MGRNWSPEQRQAAAERIKQRQLEKNAEKANGANSTMITEQPGEQQTKKKYMPYIGADELPIPKKGEIYGESRYYADSHNLIRVRKKIIRDLKNDNFDYVVVRDSVINVGSEEFRKSPLFAELKKCGISGVV